MEFNKTLTADEEVLGISINQMPALKILRYKKIRSNYKPDSPRKADDFSGRSGYANSFPFVALVRTCNGSVVSS